MVQEDRGKIHFFGVWAEPQAALESYLPVAADLHAGRRPTCSSLSGDKLTVKAACNHFLTYQLEKARTGEIGHRCFGDCRSVLERFAAFVGP